MIVRSRGLPGAGGVCEVAAIGCAKLSLITLGYSGEVTSPRGIPEGDKITVLPGWPPAEEFTALAHEVAHKVMHRDERRNAKLLSESLEYAQRTATQTLNAIGADDSSAPPA